MLPYNAFVMFFMFVFLYILVYIQCLYIMFLFRNFSGTNVFSAYNIIIDIFTMLPYNAFVMFFMFVFLYILVYIQCLYIMFYFMFAFL